MWLVMPRADACKWRNVQGEGVCARALTLTRVPYLASSYLGRRGALGLQRCRPPPQRQQRHTDQHAPPAPQPRLAPGDSGSTTGVALGRWAHAGLGASQRRRPAISHTACRNDKQRLTVNVQRGQGRQVAVDHKSDCGTNLQTGVRNPPESGSGILRPTAEGRQCGPQLHLQGAANLRLARLGWVAANGST